MFGAGWGAVGIFLFLKHSGSAGDDVSSFCQWVHKAANHNLMIKSSNCFAAVLPEVPGAAAVPETFVSAGKAPN